MSLFRARNESQKMDLLTIALLLAAAGLAVILLLRNKASGNPEKIPPITITRKAEPKAWQQQDLGLDPGTRFLETPKRQKYRLLNDSEQELYHRLCEAMPSMTIFAQVGVAQLALLRGRTEAQRLSSMLGRGVDFVVCSVDFSIVAAIELSWPVLEAYGVSPEEEKRQALQSLGIPLIVFRPNDLPDADAISREIAGAIIRRNRFEAER
jgi:hypothetical protein